MSKKLICLPYAGSGAGVYRPWTQLSSDLLTAVPIQLPGREELFGEPFYESLEEAVTGTARKVREAVGDQPFSIFGHCIGAILGYEVARHLLATGGPLPEKLLVSGSASPRRRQPLTVSQVSDEEAISDLWQQLGRESAVMLDPELRALLLPSLQADARLLGGYAPTDVHALPVPILALRGESDEALTSADLRDWASYTTSSFRWQEMAGGHMYLTEAWPQLWKTIEEAVR